LGTKLDIEALRDREWGFKKEGYVQVETNVCSKGRGEGGNPVLKTSIYQPLSQMAYAKDGKKLDPIRFRKKKKGDLKEGDTGAGSKMGLNWDPKNRGKVQKRVKKLNHREKTG